ncbi:putative monovalent cation/H+ antiporter subunit A [Chthonobacter rhizosphaerae]|uniref:putative monovalent cation/H+ antiporter subunit A n=1 Tax=Chthonobacter rhizosphaerae TaxID=2735553 RepID=UPI0015EE96C3|nr:putative monovalent cation/H+ antiporter subunit A [Chthonobacter rhizosphaerae]
MPASTTAPTWILIALAAPFLAALVAPVLHRFAGRAAAWILAVVPFAAFLGFVSLVGEVAGGARLTTGLDWWPSYGVRFSVLVDGLSLAFALLVTGIGTLIVLYAGGYMKGHPQAGRFLSFMLLFMGAMLGLVLADDGITLFVMWEATSITSFLLIGFDHSRARARRAALQALVITGAGGLCLLAAVILIGGATGTRTLSEVVMTGDQIRASTLYLPIFLLVLGAAFTKSAQVPLHVWLPNAMEAPTPVSAYLHSATMVKAGVYLLMRLHPVLGGTPEWTTVLPIAGGATLIVGTLMAVRQTDLKLMLAQTTVASLGLLVLLVGVSTDAAIVGAVGYLLAHAFFKGALFMVAGTIDHEAGTRDVTKLGGLRTLMPVTFASALVAAVSMAGLPPMIGFVAKEALYLGLDDAGRWGLVVAAVVGNALMFVIGFAIALKPFLGPEVHTPKHAHEGPIELILGPIVLGAVGLGAALLLHGFAETLILPMAGAVAGRPVTADLHLIPTYVSMPLILSLATIGLGVLAYRSLSTLRASVDGVVRAVGWGPDRGFDQIVAGIVASAGAIVRIVQPGRLELYMAMVLGFVAVTIIAPMVLFDEGPSWPGVPAMRLTEVAVIGIAVAGLAAVLVAKTRLTAIVSLGIQGFAVAVLFVLFGAPDLAFTQFMVETLSVVILALVLTRLSLGERDHRPFRQKFWDGVVAGSVGLGFMLLLLKVTQAPFDRTLTDFYDAYSRTIAHGRNVVNVIIVDFRGLDTLGEIAVVMITGLAILALVRVKARAPILPTPEKGKRP